MSPEAIQREDLPKECESVIAEIYARCIETAPNFGVSAECFNDSLHKTVTRYLQNNSSENPTIDDTKELVSSIVGFSDELF